MDITFDTVENKPADFPFLITSNYRPNTKTADQGHRPSRDTNFE